MGSINFSSGRAALSGSTVQDWRGWFARRWPQLLTLLLLVYFCWLLAQWIWYFLQPKPVARAAGATMSTAIAFSPATVTGLFGDVNAPTAVSQQVVVPTTLNVQLKGVFAEQGSALAHAILIVDGKEQGFRVGDQVMPGVMLKGVFGDHVLVSRGGVAEKVSFPQFPGGGGGPAPAAMGQPAPQAQAGSAQFRLNVQPVAPNVLSFSRNQLQNALQDASQLSNLGRVGTAPGGGVAIEDVPPGSLAERLGLQLGDVVRQVNGQAVNSPADLMRLYQEFDDTERVNIAGTRNGRPLQLTYNVQQ